MQNKFPVSRRQFLGTAALAGASIPLASFTPWQQKLSGTAADKLSVHIFSKHLQFLDYSDMAKAAADIGFDGVDLTVRPKGHVLPERVKEDLPKTVEAIKKNGLQPMMMTTNVIDADDPVSQEVLNTASRLGFQHYRTNWLKYPDDQPIPESLAQYKNQFQKLARLNKQLGLKGGYQNHSGLYLGAAIWDLWELLKDADTDGLGSQFDIRHAVVEGGNCWPQNLRLIQPYIKSIALKDFRWEKVEGTWKVVNVPMGEGMVDFKKYFGLLKEYNINVPVSLHLEYPIGGAEHGATDQVDQKVAFSAMKKDLQMVHKLWEEA